jgi:cyclic pyranopterin phosphate synthase
LREERYAALMGRGSVRAVLAAIEEAQAAGLLVKINVVVQRGLNDDELCDFLQFSRAHAIEIRFIEQMNTGSARAHVARTFMSGADILAHLARVMTIKESKRIDPSAPAEQHYAEELGVMFGLIASDTRPFCTNCNRLRINADGRVRTCLYEPGGIDIGITKGLCTAELMRNIRTAIASKRSFHPAVNLVRTDFAMAEIGG